MHPCTVKRHSAGTEAYDLGLIDAEREPDVIKTDLNQAEDISPLVLRHFRTRNHLDQRSGRKEKEGRTMNSSIQKKSDSTILVALACFALSRRAK